MKSKRYTADTMREALEKVKDDLGDEALVLSSRKIRVGSFLGLGGKEQIEVSASTDVRRPKTAAAPPAVPRNSPFTSLRLNDERAQKATPASVDSRMSATATLFSSLAARAYNEQSKQDNKEQTPVVKAVPLPIPRAAQVATPGTNSDSPATDKAEPAAIDSIRPDSRDDLTLEFQRFRAELRELKFAVKGLSNENRRVGSPAINDSIADEIYDSPNYEAYLELTSTGLDSVLARHALRELSKQGATFDTPLKRARQALAGCLSSMVSYADDPLALGEGQRCVLALVGPTGVGKTTTLAKLAARVALKERRRVELITLDTYRIAAVEQLRTYAEIIGAGFHVPGSMLELDALVTRLSDKAIVMIDTVGRGPRDPRDQIEVADYLSRNEEIVKCVAIQATTDYADARAALTRYESFGPSALVYTKLDETSRPGAVVATSSESGLPLLYLCTGQRVPEDIRTASVESLMNSILPPANAIARAA